MRNKFKMSWLLRCSGIILLHFYVSVTGVKSGPYKVALIRVENCTNPTQPVDKDPPSVFQAELYNTSTETNLMRGKTIVFRDSIIKKIRVKNYARDNNKWKLSYVINSSGCNRVYLPALAAAWRLKYDMATCSFCKGEYEFSNLSWDKLLHMWTKVQEYGRVLWKVEHFSDTGSMGCMEYEALIVPKVK